MKMVPEREMAILLPVGAGQQGYGNAGYVQGCSSAIMPLQKLMNEIAPTEIPVLIVGESGTGKEVVARRIHQQSSHSQKPFLKVSCGAINFGDGQVELHTLENGNRANGSTTIGTLFLDEISDLDANCQRQLLHSLPDGDGLNTNTSLFGRTIACTTREPEEEVKRGRLRSELFYRLNGVCLRLPPLRRRKEDIPIFVEHFLEKYARLFARKPIALNAQTIDALLQYPWPGNIRELENVAKKIVALDNEELAISDLGSTWEEVRPSGGVENQSSLKAASRAASMKAERELILQTLTKTHWNRKRAAEALQISYKSLLYKLKQIQTPD